MKKEHVIISSLFAATQMCKINKILIIFIYLNLFLKTVNFSNVYLLQDDCPNVYEYFVVKCLLFVLTLLLHVIKFLFYTIYLYSGTADT